jgi:nitrogen fixation/metabolism regulation signal transduction histidine kinase
MTDEERREKQKKYLQEYYQLNKERLDAKYNKWKKENKAKFIKSCCDSRKRRVERLREQGCTNAWSVVGRGVKPKFKKES